MMIAMTDASPTAPEVAKPGGSRSAWLDLAAGLAAILMVVGISIRAAFVGSDLRAMFGVAALAFYLAGVMRGRGGIASSWLKGLLVSSPGLLGTAALIMNDGLHRLPIPIGVTLTSIVCAVVGVQTRRAWGLAPGRSVARVAVTSLAMGVWVLFGVPRLSTLASFHTTDFTPAPFTLAYPDGSVVSLQDLRGRVAVLAFWASWCLPCRWELPEVQAACDRFENDPRVLFTTVDVGRDGETRERGRQYLAARGLTLPQAFDAGEAARALGVDALPTLAVIDAGGRVRMLHHGYDRSEQLSERLTTIVRELLGDP